MKKLILASLLISLCLIGLVSSNSNGTEEHLGIIEDFEVLDNPFDDGSGVVLRWKPLPREQRVIQYRLYRGVTADSLFLLSHIDIDPALGVIGDELFFYDKDYQVFFDLETAPGRLRKEKHQAADSPLYGAIPRDATVMERLIPHFSVLGAIKNSNFYHRSKKISSPDGNTLAGYRVNQFENMFANPKAGSQYFYTVLAVSERGRLLPYAPIKDISPRDDRPDTTAVVHNTLLRDKGVWNFEWTGPANSQDIAAWEAWLMPISSLEVYLSEQQKNSSNPYEGNYAAWQSSAIPLFQIPHMNPNASIHYHSIDLAQLPQSLPQNLENYRVIFGNIDYSDLSSYCFARPTRIKTEEDLPMMPSFVVQDKNNDKGDANLISIGKPIAYINQAAFSDKAKRNMNLNYELATNGNYKLRTMIFGFYTADGTLIGEATEHFIDKAIRYRFPAEYAGLKEMEIRIQINLAGEQDSEPAISSQKLHFDEKFKRFVGQDVYLNGQNLSKRYYDIGSKSKLDFDFNYGKRTTAMIRLYDDIIAYEDVLYKPIPFVDSQTRLLALDPTMMIEANEELGDYFSASLYREQFEKQMADMQKEISRLKEASATYTDGAVPDSIASALSHYQAKYDYITNHDAFKAASAAKSERSWRRQMIKARQKNARTYAYKMLVTDGKALYSESEAYSDDKGNIWNFPRSEWFDDTKYPTLIGSLLLAFLVVFTIYLARRGRDLYIRPIAGLAELDNAVGRATEMGRPVMFVPGWGTLGDVCTIAAMMILNQVAKKTAEFDVRLISPNCDYFVVPLAQEMVKTAYSEVGRPDSYNQNDVFFVSDMQFAFSAAVNGVTIRERAATIFYMGYFNAEALLMTETGNQCGAIQIAATDAITQIPFFITTCDYTLIGEEFYAASAYMSQDRDLVSMLKAQDYFKIVIVIVVSIGTLLSTFHINTLVNIMPLE